MARHVTVRVLENGPLEVHAGSATVRYCGEPVEVPEGEPLFLCRCGGTKNPPFCDDSHLTNGFAGASEAGERRPLRVWEGKTIRTVFNPNACMHVFHCKPLDALRARELEGDTEAAAEIARVVMTCPSGALRYESTAVASPAPAKAADVDIIEGGEVRMQCAFDIDAELLEGQQGDRATLCRCGLSKNKPWCDGRHRKREGFR